MTRIPASERRAALIDAALRVVSRNGLAQATTRAIVAEAGMSLASFHYAFESRDELVDELITTVIGREQQAVLPDPIHGADAARDPRGGPAALLRAPARRPRARAGDARTHAVRVAIARTASARRSPVRAVRRTRRARARTRSEHSGARWRSPVDRVARVLVAFTDGLTLTWLVERDDDAARAVVAAAADALTRMADTR